MRYFKLYQVLLKLNFAALLAYRANFINNIIGTVGWMAVSIGSMFFLTVNTKTVYGWEPLELLAVTGGYSVIVGIFHLFFSRNFERFSRLIHNGELDTLLLKPLDSQFLISCWLVTYTSLIRVILGSIFTCFILQQLHISLSWIQVIGLFVLILCSIMLLYAIWFGIVTITIWLTNVNLVDFMYSLSNVGRYPPEMFRQTGNIFLFIFVPLTLVITVPIKVILQKASLVDIALLLGFSVGLFVLSRLFWLFALRYYTSAS